MSGSAASLSAEREARFWDSVAFISRFFMGQANVQRALEELVERLEALHIPYAIVGALALGEAGYRRATVDVDVLLTADGLATLQGEIVGRGYSTRVPGGRGMRDLRNGVDIDVVVAGEYPGDGKPKPVAFPDPVQVAVRGARISLLPLRNLVELKIASGMTAPHRLRDLADVLELIRAAKLGRELADELDPFVRDRYLELWSAAQQANEEESRTSPAPRSP